MFIDVSDRETRWQDVYRLVVTFIQPRPIALVSSLSPDGIRNLAPFSFYNAVSANPPIVMFAPGLKRDGQEKDTLRNVAASREFVIASVTQAIAEQMVLCSADLKPEGDEFEHSGLTAETARIVQPPLVLESPVNMECRVHDIIRFGDQPGAGSVVFGRIVAIHVSDAVLADDGLVDPAKLQAIGRLGRQTYTKTTDLFDLHRPT